MNDEVVKYYSGYDEKSRLASEFSLERIRSREIIGRLLESRPLRILDVGGGAGAYSFWLAGLGHRVDLVDLTPKHIQEATAVNAQAPSKLESIAVGDATALQHPDGTFDLVLLMGPLYHIQDRSLRIAAIRESLRVLKPDGRLAIACISRFASLIDGFQFGFVDDPEFKRILDEDMRSGDHANKTGNPTYFTDAHFHLPEEIEEEARAAGGESCKLYPVEGIGSMIPKIWDRMKEREFREYLLEKIRETEGQMSMLGMSSHIMGIVSKSATSDGY
jgi:SAM-dependent methyltransferase